MESSKRIKSDLSTLKTILDLPSDTLLLILSRLDQKDHQSLSFVSKPFLDLSNHFVRELTFKTLPNDRSVRQIFTRFSFVNRITLNTNRIARALTAISKSQLKLEALRITGCPTYPKQYHMVSLSGKLKIKSLALVWFSKVKADQVVEFIRLFPSLEELYFEFSYEWDDAGIESLSLMVPNLRKIDLGRNRGLTDRSLYALSSNCVNLEHIEIVGCEKFTPQGFCTFLLGCRNLRYLDLPCFRLFPASDLLLAETVSACENVQHLLINYSLIRDATLGIIAKSRASLTSLYMKTCSMPPNVAYSMTGLSSMLCAFQGLKRLAICLPLPESDKFVDKKMSELVKSLPCLSVIAITSYCPIYATLFSLIENCPLMEYMYVKMNISAHDWRRKAPVARLVRKNFSVKHINLLPSPDATFKIALASFCPCVKNWDGNFPLEVLLPAVNWT
ncbi:hypothetical protein QQ045_015376 [Rhodiola kirilowii]